MTWLAPIFAQATVPDPNILSQAAEKYGVIGVLSVICVALALALYKTVAIVQAKDAMIVAAKEAQISERDKRIETEREYGRYLQKVEQDHGDEVKALLAGQLEVANRTKDAVLTLKEAIERDQRSRP